MFHTEKITLLYSNKIKKSHVKHFVRLRILYKEYTRKFPLKKATTLSHIYTTKRGKKDWQRQ